MSAPSRPVPPQRNLAGILDRLGSGSVRLRSATNFVDIFGRGGVNLAANADYVGGQWVPLDRTQPSALLQLLPNGTWTLFTAPATPTGNITWTQAAQFGADSGWLAPTYAANWSDFGSPATTGGYRRDTQGFVCLKGLVKKAVALALPDTIFTLPAGYHPATRHRFVAASSAGYTEVIVDTDGGVKVSVGGSATYTSIEGVRFDPAT